jgi:multicomponent Na+:H+ antiporter subunit D
MSDHLPILVFLIPFLAAICMPLIGLNDPRRCRPVALTALGGMFLLSIATLWRILSQGEIRYAFSGWTPPAGIEWVADEVAGIMVLLLSALAFLSLLHTHHDSVTELGGRTVPYHAILMTLVSGLTGIVYAGDLFNLFVFLEIAALSGYALVGIPGGRSLVSAFRYLIMGSLGASFYLLGVSYFYAATGTLNMADLAQRLPDLLASKAVIGGLSFMFIGLGIKMAIMPLHGWLPDAYTEAPDAVSPLLAALVTKVALLAWIRILYWVLAAGSYGMIIEIFGLLWVVGALAAVGGAVLALTQQDLKRRFAYGGLAHIGLILVGVGQGTQAGVTGALFYLINDAVMQCLLFIMAGAIGWRYGVRTLDDLARTRLPTPWIITGFVVAALSMIGLPPTGGFFGKWYIVLSAIENENYVAVAAVVLTTVLTMAYFIQVLEPMLRDGETGPRSPEIETPLQLRLSAGVLSAAIIGLGLWSDRIVQVLLHATSRLGL